MSAWTSKTEFSCALWPQGCQTQGPCCGHLEAAFTSPLGTSAFGWNYLDCLIAKQAWNAVSAASLWIIPNLQIMRPARRMHHPASAHATIRGVAVSLQNPF